MNNPVDVRTSDVEILIVEDSPTQRELLQHLLEGVGYGVRTALDGQTALDMVRQKKPALIISDIMMPVMDGYTLCKEIKASEHLRDIPVILLTSLSDPADVIRGLQSGADNFIPKPFDDDYLLNHIRSILINRELRRTVKTQMGVEIVSGGQKYLITSARQQILDILLSTYEAVVEKNARLIETQEQLKLLNEQLEAKVDARTASLRAEIAARKRLDESLIKLSSALEQTADVVVITDREGVIEYVNPAFVALTGYSREEALGQTPRLIKSGKYDRRFYEHLWATILSGQVFRMIFTNRKKNGELYEEEQTITPIKDGQGNITHFIATGKDITEHKLLTEQLRQAQKLEALGQLTGGIAHDFNNLLTVILAFSEILLRKIDPAEKEHRQVKEIRKAGERAAALVDQLLAFSRKQVIQPRVLDLNAAIADVEKMLKRVIGEDIDLVTVLDPKIGLVLADAGQIDQIIMNLAVNARDAMPRGGELTIETSNVELDEDYARHHAEVAPGWYVMMAVSDAGCGMDPETASHIFEPFYTTKELGKGTGLGLATVFGIVKQSGGHIGVYSEPGRGTAFKIYLPRADKQAAAETKHLELTPLRGTETVLLVEDEPVVRELVQDLLADAGYTVLTALGRDEAQRLCEQHADRLKLLLTDVVLPRMSGRDLAECLAPLVPEMKVLYMSGYADNAITHHGMLSSDMAFLQKPFTEDALLRKVREALDQPAVGDIGN